MGLLHWFRRRRSEEGAAQEPSAETAAQDHALELYSGMRVEVTALDGQMLFVAKLMSLQGNTAQLHQYSEASSGEEDEPAEPRQVRIRGYHDRARKAVYMEGTITPLSQHRWQVEELVVVRFGNDRAFFRLDTNLEASLTVFRRASSLELPCRLLNISVGGACVATEHAFHEGDKFLLRVRLLEDRDVSVMYCQVLRILSRKENRFEYGCRFLELNEADQDRITQNIFAVQRQKRSQGQL